MPIGDEEWMRLMPAIILPTNYTEEAQKQKEQVPNITIIKCENCKYDKCEFYNRSGNSWCPRCKGVNYHI